MSPRRIAVLIDGGFFLKRLPHLVSPARCDTPEHITACIRHMCHNHVVALTGCDPRQSGLSRPGQPQTPGNRARRAAIADQQQEHPHGS